MSSSPDQANLPISNGTLQRIRQLLAPDFRRVTENTRTLATALFPASPADGEVVRYKALAAATGAYSDALWTFVYSAVDAYWYNAGCMPIVREIDTQETTASATYANLLTTGPALVLPFAGDYLFFYGCLAVNSGAGNVSAISPDFGPGAVDADNALVVGQNNASIDRPRVKTIVAAGSTVTCKYRVTAGTGTFEKRFLNVTPLRCR